MNHQSIQYKIIPINPNAHLFEVSCFIERPNPEGQVFSLPNWIPGSYMIRDFAKNINSMKATANHCTVNIEKIDKASWCVTSKHSVTIHYQVYAWDLSVRSAHLDQTHGFFNGTSVFLQFHGLENLPHKLEIQSPEGKQYQNWQVATALPRDTALPYSFGNYIAENYDELIDHPVEMGNFNLTYFEVNGIRHDIALTGKHRADLSRLKQDLQIICQHHINMFGQPLAVNYYLFLVMVVGDGYGGLEHRNSCSLLRSRTDLPQKNQNKATTDYQTFLGLCSHEYFHTWNIKRIKPAQFIPYQLSNETYTNQLWAYEGITSYYDDISLVRCGLISAEEYFDILSKTISRVLSGHGRFKQSVAESSLDAWTKFYKQDENAPNAIVSYYTKGSLIALCLDLIIRKNSQHKKSLDDIMVYLWTHHGVTGKGTKDFEIEQIIQQQTGIELTHFFQQYLYGTDDLPLAEQLLAFGVDYQLVAEKTKKQDNKEPTSKPSLGIKITQHHSDVEISHVYNNSAAQKAGISAKDTIIAIDNIKVTQTNFKKIIQQYPVDSNITLHAFRRDELMTFDVTLKPKAHDVCVLTPTKTDDEEINHNFKRWLNLGNDV